MTFQSNLSAPYNEPLAYQGDGDALSLFYEYVIGSDATMADPASLKTTDFSTDNGNFVLQFETIAGLTDVSLFPERLESNSWIDSGSEFSYEKFEVSGGRVLHVWTSVDPVMDTESSGIYRLALNQVSPPNLEPDPGILLGSNLGPFLAGGDAGWVPSAVGDEMVAPLMAAGQQTSMALQIDPAWTGLSFQYAMTAGSGATLTVKVDGVVVETLDDTDGSGSSTVNFTGTPSLIEWVVDYGTPTVALNGEPVASISGFSPL